MRIGSFWLFTALNITVSLICFVHSILQNVLLALKAMQHSNTSDMTPLALRDVKRE